MVCTRKFPENVTAHLTTMGLADLTKRDAPEFFQYLCHRAESTRHL